MREPQGSRQSDRADKPGHVQDLRCYKAAGTASKDNMKFLLGLISSVVSLHAQYQASTSESPFNKRMYAQAMPFIEAILQALPDTPKNSFKMGVPGYPGYYLEMSFSGCQGEEVVELGSLLFKRAEKNLRQTNYITSGGCTGILDLIDSQDEDPSSNLRRPPTTNGKKDLRSHLGYPVKYQNSARTPHGQKKITSRF